MASNAADEARKYLQEKEIPILFESLMTSLMYHKPDDAVDFMLRGLWLIKSDPNLKVSWDTFIDSPPPPFQPSSRTASANARRLGRLSTTNEEPAKRTPPPKSRPQTAGIGANVEATPLPNIPIVILLGGPGGRKSTIAHDVAKAMSDETDTGTGTGTGIVHISIPHAILETLEKHRHLPEWQDAAIRYEAGQPLPDNLAMNVVRAELSKRRDAKLIILDGYPRTLNQVAQFEREIKKPDMAVIIDFDEETLRKDLEHKDLNENVIHSRLQEYKLHTLPAAKYYDDDLILHLIAGEQSTETITEQLKGYIRQALNPRDQRRKNESVQLVNGDRLPPRDVPVIIIIGAPGSLKAEYCRRLVQRYDGFVHLSMGELLKERAAIGDELGQEIANLLSRGEFVAGNTCGDLLFNAMRQAGNSWGFVVEGYPRKLPQAEEFEKHVYRTDLVLLIDCTEQFCLINLRRRLGDEQEDAAKQRLAIFKQHTLPMLKYYDEKGKLKVIEGDRDSDEVFEDVIHALDGVFIPQGVDQ